MSKLILLSTITLASMLSFTGCKKYEAGPDISFSSKKERIANTWKVETFLKQNADHTFEIPKDFEIYYGKDGNYSTKTGGLETSGKWEFIDKDIIGRPAGVKITYTSGSEPLQYTIKKLEEDKHWFYFYDKDSVKHEFHLIAK